MPVSHGTHTSWASVMDDAPSKSSAWSGCVLATTAQNPSTLLGAGGGLTYAWSDVGVAWDGRWSRGRDRSSAWDWRGPSAALSRRGRPGAQIEVQPAAGAGTPGLSRDWYHTLG